MFEIGDLVRVTKAMPGRRHLTAVIVGFGTVLGSPAFADCKFSDGSRIFVKFSQLEHVKDVDRHRGR